MEIWREGNRVLGSGVFGQNMERRRMAKKLEGWIDCTDKEKGEGRDVRDYTGVTLMPTLYKVYNNVGGEIDGGGGGGRNITADTGRV